MKKSHLFENVIEADEIERFFRPFVITADDRTRLRMQGFEADWKNFPETMEDALKDIKEIWRQKGLITPAELRAELIQKYIPDTNPTIMDYIRGVELAHNKPESTTGYLGKEHAYITSGLAHLYTLETGRPVAVAEVDFSNMGGTNEHFKSRLAAEKGIPVSEVDFSEAMTMTDRAVRLLAGRLTTVLSEELDAGARIIPIRTGGDELRIFFTGVSDPEKLEALSTTLHVEMEKQASYMGLQDHPHMKAPKNRIRNGFGAALAIENMACIENPDSFIREMDSRIRTKKYELGMLRHGDIDIEFTQAEIKGLIESGKISVPEGQTAEQFTRTRLEFMKEKARLWSQSLRRMNPMHNPELDNTLHGYDEHILKSMKTLAPRPFVSAGLPKSLTLSDAVKGSSGFNVTPLSSPDECRMSVAEKYFNEKNIRLTDEERYVLSLSISGLMPKDPSAQVSMPDGIIVAADIYAADTAGFRRQFSEKNKDVKTALQQAGLKELSAVTSFAMGISFHNLGGINDILGHHSADLVLRHMASSVIGESIAAAGISGEKKAYEIAHHGGGNFVVIFKPGCTGNDGNTRFVSEQKMCEIDAGIAARVQMLNETGIEDFLRQAGVKTDTNLRHDLKKQKLEKFADIKDPKERNFTSGGKSFNGRIDGIYAVSIAEAIPPEQAGKAKDTLERVRIRADKKMDAAREVLCRERHAPSKIKFLQKGGHPQ